MGAFYSESISVPHSLYLIRVNLIKVYVVAVIICDYHYIVMKYFWVSFKIMYILHDPSEIILISWFGPQETFLIISNVENRCAA